MADLLAAWEKVSAAGLATLLFLVLAGNKLRIWRWGSDFEDLKATHQEKTAALTKQVEYWQHLSERFLGLSETQGELLKIRTREIEQIVEANDGLLRPRPRPKRDV